MWYLEGVDISLGLVGSSLAQKRFIHLLVSSMDVHVTTLVDLNRAVLDWKYLVRRYVCSHVLRNDWLALGGWFRRRADLVQPLRLEQDDDE